MKNTKMMNIKQKKTLNFKRAKIHRFVFWGWRVKLQFKK